ncbi:MAG: DedA family protein [Rhodospirillaceae bacterium]|nr:DedA family protein [Rhodospirillaceae bacterium]
MSDLLALFASAFTAATLLPGGSEVVLGALVVEAMRPIAVLVAVATLGNTLGSVVNWAIGRFLARYADRRWFPLTAAQHERYGAWYQRWGIWSLLLAWMPIIGDPLTVIAGLMGTRIVPFVLIVAVAKGVRYVLVAAGVVAVW